MKLIYLIVISSLLLSCNDGDGEFKRIRQIEYFYESFLGIEVPFEHLFLDKYFDHDGKIVKIENFNSDRTFYTIEKYTYDKNGRLVEKSDSNFSIGIVEDRVPKGWTIKYYYDSASNLIMDSANCCVAGALNSDYTNYYSYNSKGQLINMNSILYFYNDNDIISEERQITKNNDTVLYKTYKYSPNNKVVKYYNYEALIGKDSSVYNKNNKVVYEVIERYNNYAHKTIKEYKYNKSGNLISVLKYEYACVDGIDIIQNHLKRKLVYEYD